MSQPQIERALSRLRPTDHLCWIYSDEAERQAALSACRRAAACQDAPLRILEPGTRSTDPAAPAAREAHGPGGSPTRQDVQALLAQAARASPPPWLVADLSLAACEEAADSYGWLEELWSQAAAASLHLIELYDTARVGPERLLGILLSHNLIVWEEALYLNDGATVPPRDEGRLQPHERIVHLLEDLGRWTEVRVELEKRLEELGAFEAIARAVNLSLSLDEILQATLDQIVALVRADAGYLSLRGPSGRGLLSFVLRGAPPQIAELLADRELVGKLDSKIEAHAEPAFVRDLRASSISELVPAAALEEGYASLLFNALRSRGKVQGAIALAARGAGRFGAGEAALLKSLSEQVGVALDNACLYAQARQRAEEMSSLYELSLAATSLDPEDILRLIGEQIMDRFHAACFFVALVEKGGKQLRFAHVIDEEKVVAPFVAPVKEEGGLTGYVLSTGQPLLVSDLEAEEEVLPVQPIHYGRAARSWLGVPLVVKGRAIGVMSVQAYVPGAFDQEDQRLLSMAAQQAASALENARLYQETHALERRYHALLEQLNDGYAVLQERRVVFANARLGEMLGLPSEALLDSSLEELLAWEERQSGALPAAPPGSQPVNYRTQFQKGDGSALPVEVTLHWIEYEGEPALAVLCRDISRQVRLEAQLIQAEKLSAVGQLVSGVAHELNNPLTTIKGYVQLMQGERLSPTIAADLRRVEDAADRCRRIVRDLLTFARRYEPEFTDTHVNEMLQRTAALRSYDLRVRNIALRWDLDPLLPEIEADAHRLQQVVLNLIFNAEQALLSKTQGGLITIRSRTLPGGAGIRFEIADNGPGIRPEHLDRIFDPFFTTKEVGMGTGLGLSISYGIVREHGGRIWAESHFGEGAAFIVELPLTVTQGGSSGEGGASGART